MDAFGALPASKSVSKFRWAVTLYAKLRKLFVEVRFASRIRYIENLDLISALKKAISGGPNLALRAAARQSRRYHEYSLLPEKVSFTMVRLLQVWMIGSCMVDQWRYGALKRHSVDLRLGLVCW